MKNRDRTPEAGDAGEEENLLSLRIPGPENGKRTRNDIPEAGNTGEDGEKIFRTKSIGRPSDGREIAKEEVRGEADGRDADSEENTRRKQETSELRDGRGTGERNEGERIQSEGRYGGIGEERRYKLWDRKRPKTQEEMIEYMRKRQLERWNLNAERQNEARELRRESGEPPEESKESEKTAQPGLDRERDEKRREVRGSVTSDGRRKGDGCSWTGDCGYYNESDGEYVWKRSDGEDEERFRDRT